ncbi:hypothetical protein OGAPHI_001432 [Ogataea philodendri]|uniref:Zn(2)-C6 fungal-type domain-containing protein n=1 Tax=Ogataea philodendri TaxID=1378263 RepID=A0A9P8PCK3_9ASCO|nr:uncharacterized protein OGAPHI_001432 [Ogataea philodendri]KAH3669311.1 hypothetical protein OGAPHI_001432 [Ogataea philodendri]
MTATRDEYRSRTKRGRMTKPKKETPPAKRRVRTGCLTCRRKHKKCDENRPKCDFCTAKGLECVWPEEVKKNVFVNNSFKDFRFNQKQSRSGLVQPADSLGFDQQGLSLAQSPAREFARRKKPFSMDVSDTYLDAFDGYSRRNEYLESSLTTNYPVMETSDSPLSGLFNTFQELPQESQGVSLLTRTSSYGLNSLEGLDGSVQSYSMNSANSYNGKMSSASSITSDMSLGNKEMSDFEHRYSFIEPDKQSSAPKTYDLSNTLQDLMCLVAATNDTSSGETLPNNETIFEFFADKSTLEAPVVEDAESMLLMETYVDQVAYLLNKSDEPNSNVFLTVVPEMAETFPALQYAMMAISSRHLERVRDDYYGDKTLQYYNYALKQLGTSLNSKQNVLQVVTCCVLLCYFEVLCTDPETWRTRLEKCAAVLKACNITASSENNLERALFWSFIELDVGCCSGGEKPSIIPTNEWFSQVPESIDTEMHSMLYLTAQVFELVSSGDDKIDFDADWKSLWESLSKWELNRSTNMRSFQSFKRNDLFPEILYSNSTAICGNQLFHLCCILMLQTKPRLVKIEKSEQTLFQSAVRSDSVGSESAGMSRSQIWHAKQIIGINLCNMKASAKRNIGCHIVSLQGIWTAGKLFSSSHEHSIIMKLLIDLQKWTSFSMSWRGRQLTEFWKSEC